MANWTFDPTTYEEKDFQVIPVGDYRVRIFDVAERTFSSGNEGYEITLSVNGYNSKIWYYLVLDKNDPKKTNQRIGDFFNSFGITDTTLGRGHQWIGKVGAVRVKHEEYNGNMSAKVAYFINRKKQDNLAPWKETGGTTAPANSFQAQTVDPEDLPF
jgi:NAD(P)H-nitrite reductase large subunit